MHDESIDNNKDAGALSNAIARSAALSDPSTQAAGFPAEALCLLGRAAGGRRKVATTHEAGHTPASNGKQRYA